MPRCGIFCAVNRRLAVNEPVLSEDALTAIKAVVTWSRGSDDDADWILGSAAPVLDRWLVENGLLPENTYEPLE
jgi:hypothetical protein